MAPSAAPVEPDELAASERLTAFEVFALVQERVAARRPTAVIRLGDGEGALLGYPRFTSRADVDNFLNIWLRTTAVSQADVLLLSAALKRAVASADVVGLPRQKQAAAHRLWAVPAAALAAFGLVQRDTPLTHTALHRLLSHALLFRPLLADAPFLGLISCRDVGAQLRELFGVREVRWYGVRGERDEPGPVAKRHFPDGFDELRRTLTVPFPGALFLVGAGAFGKIYCHWIKDRGGIAIDIGGQFDAWAGVGRGRHAARSLDAYRAHPRISRAAAVERYNALLDQFGLDCPRASAANLPNLPASW